MDDNDWLPPLLVGFIVGGVVTALLVGLIIDVPAAPPLEDYRKIELCERVLRAELRVADFLDCLENNGLRLVVK